MKKEDIIHLSDSGKKQFQELGSLIQRRKFRVTQILHSPQTRATESAFELNKSLRVPININADLNETYLPGPYIEGINIKEREGLLGGDAYDQSRWGKYQHELPQAIIIRMDHIFWQTVKKLKIGKTEVLLSHGDPIAWWINHQLTGKIPESKRLHSMIYPEKGQAIVAIIDPQGNWFTHYLLHENG